MACLLAFFTPQAENYFTMGVNDTITIYPDAIFDFDSVAVHANFDGRLDAWILDITYPDGMEPRLSIPREDMRLPYMDASHNECVLQATLTYNYHRTIIASEINEFGYYEKDGEWISYGTVKWEPGYHGRMFDIHFELAPRFSGGTITISGVLNSRPDDRGGTITSGTTFNRSVAVIVGYYSGDVSGDGKLTIADVTALINYLLNPEGAAWNSHQIAAADVNHDGNVSITDVTALISILLG